MAHFLYVLFTFWPSYRWRPARHRPAFPPCGGDRYRRSCRGRYHTHRQPGAALQSTASWTAQPLAGLPWPRGNQNGPCTRGFKRAAVVNVL
jgi:hypothetical protein